LTDTRERIVDATAVLFQRAGYTGTGLKQIAAESGAPMGSLYHFFPGGKEELAASALLASGVGYRLLIEAVLDGATDYVTGVADVFAGAAEALRLSDYADACPIATVALEVASTNDTLRLVTAEVFEDWINTGVHRGVEAGLSAAAARDFAIFFIAALEGGFLLCRAAKSTDPMAAIGRAVVDRLRAELSPTSPAGRGRRR